MRQGLIIILGLIFQIGYAQKTIEIDLKKYFDIYGVNGCFVLYNQSENEYIKYNSMRCDSGFIPASTFKIPNSLIALNEKIILDTNQIIKWDGHEWPNKNWNQDQTLKTALKYSCVWSYVGFAEQIGIDKYNEYIKAFDYGNKDLTGPPTRFWLEGPFRISANQQVEFLKKFYNYDLDISSQSIDIVKDIIVREIGDNYKISGKSGTGRLTDTTIIMWLVGYIETDNKPYFYALNITGSPADMKKYYVRNNILKEIFKELKLIKK
ncbi:penicillin-binding transpeptidase domain-containing protein [Bacteroidota bacterium]